MVRPGKRLQFGHGCDAVETAPDATSAASVPMLQFGHGCDAVETGSSVNHATPDASFNSATVVTPWKPLASIGVKIGDGKLQFGHGCDAVETSAAPTWRGSRQ